ncbi:MAG TPA: cupin domain-containing protein [Gaiellaceae bacterium]|jgi:quercetin dioxygenase-like cupin family protein
MKALVAALAAAVALVVVAVASAAGKPPIVAQPLGVGQIVGSAQVAKSINLDLSKPAKVVFVQVKIKPGGDFGWHTHSSAVAVAVVSGTLTLYDSSDVKCAAHPITAGHGFMESANHIHLARNEGKTVAKLFVAYLGAPPTKALDSPAAQPSQCEAVN